MQQKPACSCRPSAEELHSIVNFTYSSPASFNTRGNHKLSHRDLVLIATGAAHPLPTATDPPRDWSARNRATKTAASSPWATPHSPALEIPSELLGAAVAPAGASACNNGVASCMRSRPAGCPFRGVVAVVVGEGSLRGAFSSSYAPRAFILAAAPRVGARSLCRAGCCAGLMLLPSLPLPHASSFSSVPFRRLLDVLPGFAFPVLPASTD